MDVFGSFALVLALVCAVYAFVGGIAAIVTRHPLLVKSTRQAGIATCCLVFLATLSLEYLFFSDNFSNAYVVWVLAVLELFAVHLCFFRADCLPEQER